MRFPILLLALTRSALAALPPDDFIPDENPAFQPDNSHAPPPGFLQSRQLQPDQVTQTTGSVPLWFDVAPTYYDVVQRKVSDCWLSAAAIAVVLASPDWMTRLFTDADGKPLAGTLNPNVTNTQIRLWDPWTGKNHFFPTSTFNQSKTEDHPGERWWNSAVIQGMVQLGAINGTATGEQYIRGIFPNNATIDPAGGDAEAALAAMTGYNATSKYPQSYQPDQYDRLYDDLSKAWEYHTPIVISTRSNESAKNGFPDSVMKGQHAYAVMWTVAYPKGTKTAVLRNPWGMSVEATMQDIVYTMNRVVHLEDFRELDWVRATGGLPEGSITTTEGIDATSTTSTSMSETGAPTTTTAPTRRGRLRRRSESVGGNVGR